MGPLLPTLPKARIISTTLFVCISDTSANQDTTTSRRRFDAWVSERISILLDVLMGRSSSKSELPETLPSDGLSDSTGPSVVCTCRFRGTSFCRPWASANKSTPPYLDRSTRPTNERGTDVITPPYDDYLQPFLTRAFDHLRQSPPVDRLWTSPGMCVGSTDRSSAKGTSSSSASITKSISGTKTGALPGFLMPTATTPGRPRSACPKVKPSLRWTG